MTNAVLTREQEAFLEECNLEFSERFTESDIEFKKIFDSEIPPPPIVTPWYGRLRYNNRDRDRPSGSYGHFGNRREGENRRDGENRGEEGREDRDRPSGSYGHFGNRREGENRRDGEIRGEEGREEFNHNYRDRGYRHREKHYRPY